MVIFKASVAVALSTILLGFTGQETDELEPRYPIYLPMRGDHLTVINNAWTEIAAYGNEQGYAYDLSDYVVSITEWPDFYNVGFSLRLNVDGFQPSHDHFPAALVRCEILPATGCALQRLGVGY